MRLMIFGLLLGLLSLWGGGYLFYLFTDTWMHLPMGITAGLGTGLGVVLLLTGLGDI